jgi:hypothetical protein
MENRKANNVNELIAVLTVEGLGDSFTELCSNGFGFLRSRFT